MKFLLYVLMVVTHYPLTGLVSVPLVREDHKNPVLWFLFVYTIVIWMWGARGIVRCVKTKSYW